jgi:hypothetical protein
MAETHSTQRCQSARPAYSQTPLKTSISQAKGHHVLLGFKRFDRAAVTISGIELVQKIQKHQSKISTWGGRSAPMPELWIAVLAA